MREKEEKRIETAIDISETDSLKALKPMSKEDFSSYLSFKFSELKLSQKEIAKALFLDERTIRGYLGGEHKSDYETQQRIIKYIKTRYDRDIGSFRYIHNDDFLALLSYLDKKLELSERLSQAELAEIYGISQGEYSKNREVREYSVYEEYDVLKRIYNRIAAGEQDGKSLYLSGFEVVGRELEKTIDGIFTFSDGRFISIAAIGIAKDAADEFSEVPSEILRFLNRFFQELQRIFDYPFNDGIFYMIREAERGFYINKLDEIMKFRVGFNSEIEAFADIIADYLSGGIVKKWISEHIKKAFMGSEKNKSYILEYFREHKTARDEVVLMAYNMLNTKTRYSEGERTKLEQNRYSTEGNARYFAFSQRLKAFSEYPLKIQELILENISAFCPKWHDSGSYLSIGLIKKYRLLNENEKAEVKARLEQLPTVSMLSSDFDVIVDCREMIKLSPKIGELMKKKSGKRAEEIVAENDRRFRLRAEIYTENLINIMHAVELKLSFTPDEWYFWMLGENALRIGNISIIKNTAIMSPGDFPDENALSAEELEAYKEKLYRNWQSI